MLSKSPKFKLRHYRTADCLDAAPDPAIAGAPAHDVKQRLREHLAELGIVSAKGRNGTGELLRIIADSADNRVPPAVRGILDVLARQYSAIGTEIGSIDKTIMVLHRSCEASRRLARYQALARSSRPPWLPRWRLEDILIGAQSCCLDKQHTTGGMDRLGSITKQGNRYLRWLLVVGAMAVIRYAQKHGTKNRPWLARLMERRPTKVAAVALANKIARMAWAIMVHGDRYKEPKLLWQPESRRRIDRQRQLARA